MLMPTSTPAPQPATIDVALPAPAAAVQLVKNHIRSLDFLRAVAALSVCLYHFSGVTLPKSTNIYLQPLFAYGWVGVDIFFVISGFIIPYSLLGKNHQISNFGSYIAKRIIRINPPAYIAMGLVLVQRLLIDYVINHNRVYTGSLSGGQLLHNLLFTIPFTHYQWVVGIFWTLAIEFQFYIFIGLLFTFLFERYGVWSFMVGYLLANALQYLPFSDSANFFHFSPMFALGGATLLFYQNRLGWWLYGLVMLLFAGLAYWQLGLPIAAVGVATALSILWLKVENKWLVLLGRMSYSFYLVHALIGTTCEFVLIRIIAPDTEGKKVTITLLCLVGALVGAYVFYVLIEKPFIGLARRYGNGPAAGKRAIADA